MGDVVTDDWFAGWKGHGRAPGRSGSVQVVVTGLADGDASWHARLEDGVVVEIGPGAPADPDVTLTLPAPVAQAVAAGSLSPSAAFMQGRMKTAGDPGLVLDVLAAVDARG